MQTILILGGGKSAIYLIDYLAESCLSKSRKLILADLNLGSAKEKLKDRPNTQARQLDIEDPNARQNLIREADLVISMLPAFLHPTVAKDCLDFGRHFFSASYESDEMRKMKAEIEGKNLFFLNECGLDPGIDHISAMKIIDSAKADGEEIISFKSYCGGLLAPESEDNPWKYKFTWNPRNVVLAGQGVSRYIDQGELKFVPYQRVFSRLDSVKIPGLGSFEGYPNRDSLSYRKTYGLEAIPTLLRGTLRREGYCKAWNIFVQLGMCDDSYELDLPAAMSLRQFLNTFLPYHPVQTVEEKVADIIPDFDFQTWEKIQWLGFFGTDSLPRTQGSPAAILQAVLEKNWRLYPEDKDMIVMQHQFEIEGKSGKKSIISTLVCFGEDSSYTAMAKTVGLPLAIAVDLFLDGKIKLNGLHTPVIPALYKPILKELEKLGIHFREEVLLEEK